MVGKPNRRSPEEWRKLADSARKMAEGLATEANRQQLLEIAANYDRLAEQAEREQKPSSS